MLKELVTLNQLHLVDSVCLGAWVDSSRFYVLRCKRQTRGPCFFGLLHIQDCCCLVYEAAEVDDFGMNSFAPRMGQRQPQAITIVCLSEWEARSVVWKSSLSQWAGFVYGRHSTP